MTAYGPPPAPRSAANPDQRARLLALVAGGLGVLMFIWGFLTWFTENTGEKTSYGGYVFIGNSTAAIGFSIAAGLVALAHVYERKPLALLPLALAATSLLLLIGLFIGKGKADSSSGSPNVGVSAGFVLGLITVILQVAALVLEWLTTSGRLPAKAAAAPAAPWSGGYGGQPNQFGPSTSYGTPQGEYRPPQPYAPPAYPGAPAAPAAPGVPGAPAAPGAPGGAAVPGAPGGPGAPGAHAAPSAGEPTRAMPTPGAGPAGTPPGAPGQPGGQPGPYPPPPAGEYPSTHPQ